MSSAGTMSAANTSLKENRARMRSRNKEKPLFHKRTNNFRTKLKATNLSKPEIEALKQKIRKDALRNKIRVLSISMGITLLAAIGLLYFFFAE